MQALLARAVRIRASCDAPIIPARHRAFKLPPLSLRWQRLLDGRAGSGHKNGSCRSTWRGRSWCTAASLTCGATYVCAPSRVATPHPSSPPWCAVHMWSRLETHGSRRCIDRWAPGAGGGMQPRAWPSWIPHRDGYIRTSCKKFALKSLNDRLIHLTNDAVRSVHEARATCNDDRCVTRPAAVASCMYVPGRCKKEQLVWQVRAGKQDELSGVCGVHTGAP